MLHRFFSWDGISMERKFGKPPSPEELATEQTQCLNQDREWSYTEELQQLEANDANLDFSPEPEMPDLTESEPDCGLDCGAEPGGD